MGDNTDYALGLGTSAASSLDLSRFVQLPDAQTAVGVSANEDSYCVTFASGKATCWGNSRTLGDGYVSNLGGAPEDMGNALAFVNVGSNRVIRQLVSTARTNCALLDDASVKCWGSCFFGGCQSTYSSNYYLGFASVDEMGDALPAIALPTGQTAVSLHAGQQHVCTLLASGKAVCFGVGANGALGWDSTATTDMNAGFLGDGLPLVRLPGPLVSLACGAQFTCALDTHGTVWCFGRNGAGQLGLGDLVDRGAGEAAPLDTASLPPVPLVLPAVAVAASSTAACALLQSGVVACWGGDSQGSVHAIPFVAFAGCPSGAPSAQATPRPAGVITAQPAAPLPPAPSPPPTPPAASAGAAVGFALAALAGCVLCCVLAYAARDCVARRPLPQVTLVNFYDHADAPKRLRVAARNDLCLPQAHVLVVWASPDFLRCANVLAAMHRALLNDVGVVLLLPSSAAQPDWLFLENLDSNLDARMAAELRDAGIVDLVDVAWRLSCALPRVPSGVADDVERLLRAAQPSGAPRLSREAFLRRRARAVLLV